MNKNCFRLIFSKAIGCLIPVAEICTAQRKPGQTRGASATGVHRWALKALPLALLGILPQAFSQIAIAPNQQTISQSANGVPVMEIAELNRDGDKLTTVKQDRKIAGTDIKVELSLPTFSKQKKKNKVEPQRTLADTGSVDAPSPTRPSSASVDLPNAPSRPTSAASANVDVPNAPSRPVSVASADVDVPNAPSRPTSTASADIDAPDASSKKPASTASADVAVDLPAKKPAGKGNDDLARHMTSQQTGTDLKNALAKINASDNATVNSLKTSPVTVKVMDASGKPIEIKVTSAASLQQLHGMQVVTGEQALGLKPVGSQFGKSSQTYITITEVSPGKFIHNFTSRKPAPLKK